VGSNEAARQGPIRVFVVDDHQMFVESITRLIDDEPDMKVVGHAGSGEEAMATLDLAAHDVVVMDYRLPGHSGAVTVRAIRERLGDLAVVMVSGHDDPDAARLAAEVGCRAFVTKSQGARELVEALRSACTGASPASPADPGDPGVGPAPSGGPAAAPDGTAAPQRPRLSDRELEVLHLLADGSGTDAIAAALFISRNTVRAHVQRVISKLGAHSKLEAVAVARRTGVL
jgi:two-component system, NarL family, response regulator DevR